MRLRTPGRDPAVSAETLTRSMAEAAARVTDALADVLPEPDQIEAPLWRAMRYATLNGGKRLRPYLVLESARLFNQSIDTAMRVAVAIELVHCYSLVHDDLPAMDDSDLRRGKPTVHKEFDEAIAILAGDGLLTYAFEILADQDTHASPMVRTELVKALATAAGPAGMVGGQMLDLIAETREFDAATVTRLQRMKTGALITFSATSGAILAQASADQRLALHGYATDLGLAFQIADDLLDVTGSEADVGKQVGQDNARGKATFVSILGVEGARAQADRLADQAVQYLAHFDDRADNLRDVARFVVERRS